MKENETFYDKLDIKYKKLEENKKNMMKMATIIFMSMEKNHNLAMFLQHIGKSDKIVVSINIHTKLSSNWEEN